MVGLCGSDEQSYTLKSYLDYPDDKLNQIINNVFNLAKLLIVSNLYSEFIIHYYSLNMSISAGLLNNTDINNFDKQIIIQAPIPIFIVEGPDFVITFSNEKNMERWQRTEAEVMGKPLFDVFPEGRVQPFIGFLNDAYKTGKSIKRNEVKAEYYRNGNLNVLWFDITYEPIKNEMGEVKAIMGVSVDVTSQVIARQKAEKSEKELRLMADAMPHLVWIADDKGIMNFYNKRVYDYCGLDENSDKDLLWQTIVHAQDLEKTQKAWQNAIQEKSLYAIEHRLRMKNGSFRWFLSRAVYTENTETQTAKWFGSCTDIDDQKRAEFKIKETEEFNRKLLESNPDCVKVIDRAGRIQYMNLNGQCLLEMDDFGDYKNKFWRDLWNKENQHLIENAVEKALLGENAHFTASTETTKGTLKWWDVMVSPVINTDNEIHEIIAISRDITVQKATEEALKYRQALLEAQNEAIPDGILIVDMQGNIISYNKNFAKLWGIPDEIFRIKDGNNALSFFEKNVINSKESIEQMQYCYAYPDENFHDEVFLKDGRIISRYGNAIVGEDGVKYGWAWYFSDITKDKRGEIRIQESEEKYRGVFTKMDQGFCIVEVIFEHEQAIDYRFIETNPMFVEQTGLVNVNGKTIKEVVPEIEIVWAQTYGRVTTTGKPIRFIDYSKALNSWFEIYAFRLGDTKNSRVAILFTNITERKKAEMVIKESEERFRRLTETIPQMVWMTDETGHPEYLSAQWKKYAGEMPMVDYWTAICHPDDTEISLTAWQKCVVTGEKFTTEVRLKNKEGEYRWHVSVGVPLKDDDGNVIKWIGSITDVHDQKMREQQKDEFISIASHEMKTPLTSAKAYLQLLEMSLDESDTNFIYAKKASDAVERLNKLISELLDASKIQHGKLNYNNSSFDFEEMVDSTIENVQYSSITHKIHKIGSVKRNFLGDRDRLQQVVINLLTNAIKYSPKAHEVIVKIEEQNNQVLVSVTDKGIGMSEKHLDKVFDRYYRVEEHSIEFQGLGIGLYISYDIVKRHQGDMWVESYPEVGSTFHFTLPYVN